MLGKRYFYYAIYGALLISSLNYAAINASNPTANIKHNHSILRNSVNQIRKYIGSKQPLSDQEWRDFKATAAKVGKAVGAIVLAITGAGAGYYLWKKRSKKDDSKPEKIEQPEVPEPQPQKLSGEELEKKQKELAEAVKRGEWKTVISLSMRGIVAPASRIKGGGNILHAILDHNPNNPIDNVIKDLLEFAKINVSQRDFAGKSLLVKVIDNIAFWDNNINVHKFLTILDTLIEKGADKNEKVSFYYANNELFGSLLHYAAIIIHDPRLRNIVINKLLQEGIDSNIRDSNGKLYTDYV
jgi:hypothetical protein